MSEEKIIEHHIHYKEIDGYDETILMTMSEHKLLHNRLRREGECNIPVEELTKISIKAHERTKKGKEYRKRWREENKEKKKSAGKAYREKNKDELKEKRMEWRETNKDKIAIQQREYYDKNREKILVYQKDYHRKKRKGELT